MTTIYTNKIINTGKNAAALGEEMIILFGDNAPDTLKDYCYTIPIKEVTGTISQGDIISIDQKNFTILQVGELAQKNLAGLGHLTVNFTGSAEPVLPGAVTVEKKPPPPITTGTLIEIKKP